MWRFQLQALSEKKSFLLRLSTVSFLLHLAFLAIIFLHNQGYKLDVVKLNVHSAQIRFVPTFDAAKIAQSHQNPPKNPSKNSAHKSGQQKSSPNTLPSGKKTGQARTSGGRKASGVAPTGLHRGNKNKMQQQKKVQNSGTVLQKKSATIETKNQHSVKKSVKEAPKVVQKAENTHNFLSDTQNKFSVSGMISQFLHPAPVIEKPIAHKEEPVVEKKEEVAQEVVPTIQPVVENNAMSSEPASELIEDVMYVSPREYNALMIHQDLQQSLQGAWTPPPGVSSTLSAQVTIVIDRKGSVTSVIFKKTSGSLVYDTSIEHALYTCALPESVWSKTITITFSP